MTRFSVAIAATTIMLSGCLSRTHIIPKRDLMALAMASAETRGRRVRVVQAFQHEAGPPERQSNTLIVVGTPIHTHRGGPARISPLKGSRFAKAASNDAKSWLIAAVIVAATLAATEGARFDGWVHVDPGHPVYLFGYGGNYQVVRLRDLTPEQAAWTRKALIHPRDGAWRELERAPLNRRGWTYSVLGGVAQIPGTDGTNARGFLSHIQLGYFPHPQVGFGFDIALGWRDTQTNQTVFESRHSFEIQALPLAAGVIHAGGYGSLGWGLQLDDAAARGSRSSMVFAAGGILQLELTTRLALTGRAGFANLNGQTVNEFQFGVSIY